MWPSSFAVHRLISWYREEADVQRLLPQLATFLEHVDIGATQRNLTMTPELLPCQVAFPNEVLQ
jgi:integrase/recombinase XerD